MYEAIDLPFISGLGCADWDSSVSSQSEAEITPNNSNNRNIMFIYDMSGNTQTVDALDAIITGLQAKGFTFVTVRQLFEQKNVNPNVEYKLGQM